MAKLRPFKRRAKQSKNARRTKPPAGMMVADLEKLRPAPICTHKPELALTFKERSGVHKWAKRHNLKPGSFIYRPVSC
jgi:hypothetical protein